MMKIRKEEKGITLIALVITIIVLLILATISINMLLGDNGLITKADTAKTETRGAEVEEEATLWKINKNLDKYSVGTSSKKLNELLDDLQYRNLITDKEREEIEKNGKVIIGSREIIFTDEDDIEENNRYVLKFDEKLLDDKLSVGKLYIDINTMKNEILIESIYAVRKELGMTEEEIYMEMMKSSGQIDGDLTFKEFIEKIESEQGIDLSGVNTLKDFYIKQGIGEEKAEYDIEMLCFDYIKENFEELIPEVNIYDDTGKEYGEINYEIPNRKQEHIFTKKINQSENKFKINIDQYEIVQSGQHYTCDVFALDIINKRFLNISDAKIIINGEEKTCTISELDDGTKCIKPNKDYEVIDDKVYKVIFTTEIGEIEGFIIPE